MTSKPEYVYKRDRYGDLVLENGMPILVPKGTCYTKPYEVRPTEQQAIRKLDKDGKR